ncbi:MAG TPA: YdeI/OmpD-associated family protein, partial [Herminiimonas sp.]|nr:YdeI/OmpD-associated family protein [Herminiimonas sp.]
FAILFRIRTAKKAETRARRIAQFVDMLARHETLHPMPPSKT